MDSVLGVARGVVPPIAENLVGLSPRICAIIVKFGTAENELKLLIMVSSARDCSSSSICIWSCWSAASCAINNVSSPWLSPSSASSCIALTSSSKISIACFNPSLSRNASRGLVWLSLDGRRSSKDRRGDSLAADPGWLTLTGKRLIWAVIFRGLWGKGGGGMLLAGDEASSLAVCGCWVCIWVWAWIWICCCC